MIVNGEEYPLSEPERNALIEQIGKLTQSISSRARISGWSHGRKAAALFADSSVANTTAVPPALSGSSLLDSDSALLHDLVNLVQI